MKPGAHLQVVIHLLDSYTPTFGPLDQFVQSYLKDRRFIGAGDRRRITHLIFGIYRCYPYLEWVAHQKKIDQLNGRLLMITYLSTIEYLSNREIENLFSGLLYHPVPLTKSEINYLNLTLSEPPPLWAQLCYPQWLYDRFEPALGGETQKHLQALNQEGSVDLRVNTLLAGRDQTLEKLHDKGIEGVSTPYSPWGIRLQKRINLGGLDLYKEGIIEIQDEGAQLLSMLCDAQPGMVVCDFCAGAGGKALALAALMKNKGEIIVTDEAPNRLNAMKVRLKRSRSDIIKQKNLMPEDIFDRVLIDVPCSGTGTLRRRPELKISLTPDKIKEFIDVQREILLKAQEHVKPGGRLIYATCSLLREENEDQIDWFLKEHPEFKCIPASTVLQSPLCKEYLQLSPYLHHTDGFFGAILQKS